MITDPRAELYEKIEAVLDARTVKLVLVALIIVSLIPAGRDAENMLRPIFLIVFGSELAARFVLWRAHRKVESRVRTIFAVTDVLAYLTFLPLEWIVGDENAHLLALLRLTRLLMLLRFAKALALDIYAIVTRREQLHQFGLVTGAVVILSFVSAVILSQLGIAHDNTGRTGFIDELWWSFRQIESPDNLVPSPRVNPVLLFLSLGLTITGVFVISFIIGIGTTVVEQVVRTERLRPVPYRGHTLITGPVHASEVLIREFVRIYAKNRQVPGPEKLLTWLKYASPWQSTKSIPRVALLGRRDDPPDFLYEPLMRWVVYRQGDPGEPSALDRVSARRAKRAIMLARDDLLHEADAVTIATLAAFRADNPRAHAFVEVTDSSSVPIVERVGGPGTFALDMPRMLGMFLCQHLVTPGVEALYRDLLTADGSEIYTHLFVDEDERQALKSLAPRQTIAFADLQRFALARGGIYIIGVWLGDHELKRGPGGLVPVEGLVPWLNPIELPLDDPRVASLGATAGQIPIAALRGLIGITDSYLPLAALARDVANGHVTPGSAQRDPPPAELLEAIRAATSIPPVEPKRVTMIGSSDALPSLLHELARYVPGVEVTVFLSARGDERTPLARRLEKLGVGFQEDEPLPGPSGRKFPLERGGSVQIFTHDGPDLAAFAARTLEGVQPVEAAVFLSEPESEERDARVALRILRFVRLLEDGKVPRGKKLHVLAEFVSIDKGAHVRAHVDARKCGFDDDSCMRLTLVSTDTIKNYFMVHSAFVPGVVQLYGHLLEERGQEIIRLKFNAPSDLETVTMRSIGSALEPYAVVAFAVELKSRDVILAPFPEQALMAKDIVGVYVVGDAPRVAQLAQRT